MPPSKQKVVIMQVQFKFSLMLLAFCQFSTFQRGKTPFGKPKVKFSRRQLNSQRQQRLQQGKLYWHRVLAERLDFFCRFQFAAKTISQLKACPKNFSQLLQKHVLASTSSEGLKWHCSIMVLDRPHGVSSAALRWESETAEPVPASPDPQPHAVIVRGRFQGHRQVPAEGSLDELTATAVDHKQGTIFNRLSCVFFFCFLFFILCYPVCTKFFGFLVVGEEPWTWKKIPNKCLTSVAKASCVKTLLFAIKLLRTEWKGVKENSRCDWFTLLQFSLSLWSFHCHFRVFKDNWFRYKAHFYLFWFSVWSQLSSEIDRKRKICEISLLDQLKDFFVCIMHLVFLSIFSHLINNTLKLSKEIIQVHSLVKLLEFPAGK